MARMSELSTKLGLGMNLFPYQEQGVREVVKRFHGRALIADEMGLGKSCQALAVGAAYNSWPVVIVCPASLRLNWRKEIQMWISNYVDDIEVCVVRTGKDLLYGKILIFSYELAAQRSLDISLLKPSLVILDESHNIKNKQAIRTKRLVPICKQAPRCLLLTGTPVLNRPVELWTQLQALNRPAGAYEKYWDFARRYCGLKKGRFGWDVSGATNLSELNNYLRAGCMVRRLKRDVLTELPPKRRTRILVERVGKSHDAEVIRIECIAALKRNRGDLDAAREQLRRERAKFSGIIFKVYTEIGLAKAQFAAEWAIDNSSSETPLVLFAHHIGVMDMIAQIFQKERISFVRIDGSTSLDRRQFAVDEFQAGRAQVALLSITAASTGLTLTRASDMLIAELPFGPGLAAQAEDRIHRVGQQNAALIRYLIAEGTFDEALWGLINKKSGITHAALDNSSRSSFTADTVSAGDYWIVVDQILTALHEQMYAQQQTLFPEVRSA